MSTPTYVSAEEAVKNIKSGNRVFIHGSAATPVHLVEALQRRHWELKNVEFISITTLGDVDFNNPVHHNSFFLIHFLSQRTHVPWLIVIMEIMCRFF